MDKASGLAVDLERVRVCTLSGSSGKGNREPCFTENLPLPSLMAGHSQGLQVKGFGASVASVGTVHARKTDSFLLPITGVGETKAQGREATWPVLKSL